MKFRCLFRHLGCRQRRTGSVVVPSLPINCSFVYKHLSMSETKNLVGRKGKEWRFLLSGGPGKENLCGAIE